MCIVEPDEDVIGMLWPDEIVLDYIVKRYL